MKAGHALCTSAQTQPHAAAHTALVAHVLSQYRRHCDTGDERPGTAPADLVFNIEEKPHQKFSREGNDLVYNAKLPLVDALCGATVRLTTLDGRPLTVRIPVLCLLPCMQAPDAGKACPCVLCKPQDCGRSLLGAV